MTPSARPPITAQPTDDDIRDILAHARTIAVVGLSANPDRPSHAVAAFLAARGHRIVGVNPGLAGQRMFGEEVRATLSDIPFDIDGARVVLCDEVIFTGRSIRAALAELLDFGRPACVQLAVLVDRGGREFPIQPDFTARTIHIAENERITVQFTEVDPVDGVFIESSASH